MGKKKKVSKIDIEKSVIDIICDICNVKKSNISSKTNLKNDLGIDSIDVTEIMFGINEKFSVDIFKENIENIDTLNSLVEKLDKKINA